MDPSTIAVTTHTVGNEHSAQQKQGQHAIQHHVQQIDNYATYHYALNAQRHNAIPFLAGCERTSELAGFNVPINTLFVLWRQLFPVNYLNWH